MRFLNTSVILYYNGPIKTEVGVHCCMMKVIPIKKNPQKQLKGCWDQMCVGDCPDMTSCTSIAKVKGNLSHAECLYHSLGFVLLACKACSPLTPVSFPQPMPRGCCVSHSSISDSDVHPSCVMRPSYISWAGKEVLLCVVSLGCVIETTLLIPVCFASVLCCHKVRVTDLMRLALVLHITAEQVWE